METMTLLPNTPAVDLLTLSDADLKRWFATIGLDVDAVPHCNAADCTICFHPTSATRAA